MSPEPVVLSWSGGKDSALALYRLRRDPRYRVVALLTSVSEEYRRISHHGVREELLDAQAAAVGLPLTKIYLPTENGRACSNRVYEDILLSALRGFARQGIRIVAHGDIFLEDLRRYRERLLSQVDMAGVFPLWGADTGELVRSFVESGFEAYLTCVEPILGREFAGRRIDAGFVASLPAGVDPCGENGEYHSFVFAGPIFAHEVAVRPGVVVERDGRYYADLLPAGVECEPLSPAAIPPIGTLSNTEAAVDGHGGNPV